MGNRAVLCRTRTRLETARQVRVEWRQAGASAAQPVLVHPGGSVQLNASALAWPNPFHDAVQLRLPGVDGGTIQILDITGRLVREISVPEASTGIWDGRNADGLVMPAGAYFARPKDPLLRRDVEASKLLRVR